MEDNRSESKLLAWVGKNGGGGHTALGTPSGYVFDREMVIGIPCGYVFDLERIGMCWGPSGYVFDQEVAVGETW